ncbi:hypothetical protein Hokovirus_2_96 [Hokovirus HKV1]|uniref:Thioredoxin n=1 Tax=Hokovirus HKV1 TaxID=1977638 RepID=A0A1V0SFR9_9VIRU|nr:hypothetical protein Hokovirus_2_96 [Hokovirus HKV1]
MTNNIFKIKDQYQLDKIIKKHNDTLIIVVYCSRDCKLSRNIIDPFINLSKKYTKYYFIFANVYVCDTETEYFTIESTPHFILYYNELPISQIIGSYVNLVEKNINLLEKFINKSTRPLGKLSGHINNDATKIKYLKLLFDLTKTGVILSNNYNLESDLDDMIWEYNIHTQPNITVNSQYQPINNQDITKQTKQTKQNNKKSLVPDDKFMDTLKSLIIDEEKYKIIESKIKQKKINNTNNNYNYNNNNSDSNNSNDNSNDSDDNNCNNSNNSNNNNCNNSDNNSNDSDSNNNSNNDSNDNNNYNNKNIILNSEYDD